MKRNHILRIGLWVAAIGAVMFFAWPLLFASYSPPTVHYVGSTPDGSRLLFEIRNPSSAAWHFSGFAPNVPAYLFRTASRSPWDHFNNGSPGSPARSKLNRYVVPAKSTITFSAPKPPHAETFEVQVRLMPGSFTASEQRMEYYSNKVRMFFGGRATNHAVLQKSGVVNLTSP
jgi:hypothetical protein